MHPSKAGSFKGPYGKQTWLDCAPVCATASVLPVELVDVLDVAEQSADLLWFQWQSAAVNDAAQIVLQDRHQEPVKGHQAGM